MYITFPTGRGLQYERHIFFSCAQVGEMGGALLELGVSVKWRRCSRALRGCM